MCQLSLGITSSKKLSYELAVSLAFANTSEDHKDGFGLYVPATDYLFKFHLEPWHTISFTRDWKNKFVANSPFLLHVRKASNKTLTGDVKYNHPFVNDKLVFAHNGTLETIKGYIPYSELDSLHFFNELVKNYDNTNNLIASLKDTMASYYGKFAFIIYSKVEKVFYIIRGNTASLYVSDLVFDGELLGRVINTEEDSITKTKILLSNIGNYPISFDEKATELEKEIIYKLNGIELEKIDELKENYAPAIRNLATGFYANNRWCGYGDDFDSDLNYNTRTGFDNLHRLSEYAEVAELSIKKIADVMYEWLISPAYLEEIFILVTGSSLFNARQPEVEKFLAIFKRIESTLLIKKKTLLSDWEQYRNLGGDIFEIHNKYGVNFPYMLESNSKKLGNAILTIEKERKEKDKDKDD